MIYFLETDISFKKSVYISIKEVYGIGKKTAILVCKKAGLSKNLKTFELSNKQIVKIVKIIEDSNIIINTALKKQNDLFFKHLIDIKSYKGLRRLKGLPVRGQRTHTNAKTVRNKKHK